MIASFLGALAGSLLAPAIQELIKKVIADNENRRNKEKRVSEIRKLVEKIQDGYTRVLHLKFLGGRNISRRDLEVLHERVLNILVAESKSRENVK